jgi:hypothetical protein
MTDEPKQSKSSEPETIDGEATETTKPASTSVAIPTGASEGEPRALEIAAPANPPSAIVPLDADAVVAGMAAYQDLIPQLLTDSDYQAAGRGKRFVKKSGWRKIARAFGLSVEIRSQHVERDEEGKPLRANVVARAVHAPTGQYQDGDGGCSISEDRFSGPRGNQSKIENDLIATATTRAKNRAISDLVGMGEVSAEEADGGAGIDQPPPPPWGPEASRGARQTCGNALTYLFDGDRDAAKAEIARIEETHGGYLPTAVVSGVTVAAGILKARQEPADSDDKADEKGEKGEEEQS